MHSVTFFWPNFDTEEKQFREFEDALSYGLRQMFSIPSAVTCVITRPNRPIHIWWEKNRLVTNLDDLEIPEASLAQKVDWRKLGF